jgi:hypothetical protein
LHNKPRQNMFMNLIDKWRGFLIRIRCGLGGCNPKSRFRLLQVTPMTNMICSLILPTPNSGRGRSQIGPALRREHQMEYRGSQGGPGRPRTKGGAGVDDCHGCRIPVGWAIQPCLQGSHRSDPNRIPASRNGEVCICVAEAFIQESASRTGKSASQVPSLARVNRNYRAGFPEMRDRTSIGPRPHHCNPPR